MFVNTSKFSWKNTQNTDAYTKVLLSSGLVHNRIAINIRQMTRRHWGLASFWQIISQLYLNRVHEIPIALLQQSQSTDLFSRFHTLSYNCSIFPVKKKGKLFKQFDCKALPPYRCYFSSLTECQTWKATRYANTLNIPWPQCRLSTEIFVLHILQKFIMMTAEQ